MFIENVLEFYTARLTRRYLTFEKCRPSSPPTPDKDKSYLLYIHIPFCQELCPYCTFFKVEFEPTIAHRYFDALAKEIELYHKLGYRFDSIYIGGGTPTILPGRLARIIELVKRTWQIRQISVETNPNHLTAEILRTLKDIGVNRLSVGVQSFDNGILKSIRRLEKYGCGEEIKEKLTSIVGMFDTLNIDMIFNFPNQTAEMLAADIEIIKEIMPDQVTWYPLIVSNSRKKEIAQACRTANSPASPGQKQLYQLLIEQLADTYAPNCSGVWCFCNRKQSIDEYIVNNDEYAGLGPGALGYIKGTMYSNTFSIQQYINMMQENESPVIASRNLSRPDRIRHSFLFKLLDGSVNISDMKEKYGNCLWFYLCRELLFLFVTRSAVLRGDKLTLTPRGRYYWLIIMRTVFSVIGDYRQMQTCGYAGAGEKTND